jgi:hypothetical protein
LRVEDISYNHIDKLDFLDDYKRAPLEAFQQPAIELVVPSTITLEIKKILSTMAYQAT